MKSVLLIAAGLLASFAVRSQDTIYIGGEEDRKAAKIVEKTVNCPEFSRIRIEIPCDVSIRQGNKQSVKLVIDENLFSKMQIEVNDKTLGLKYDGGFAKRRYYFLSGIRKRAKIEITVKSLEKAQVSEAASLTLEPSGILALKHIKASGASSVGGATKTDNIEIEVSGASKINLSLKADALSADLSGASSIKLSGEAKRQSYRLRGASKADAAKLAGSEVTVHAEGVSRLRTGTPVKSAHLSGVSKILSADETMD
jgi:hypothetical protein